MASLSRTLLTLGVALILACCASASEVTYDDLLIVADSLSNESNADSAIVVGQKALDMAVAELGEVDPEIAKVVDRLARYNMAAHRFDEAEALRKRSLSIRETALGPEDLEVARSLDRLVYLYLYVGDLSEVEQLSQRSLAIKEKALAPDDVELADSYTYLAGIYTTLGRYDEARPLLEQSLAVREGALGPDHEVVIQSLHNLGVFYFRTGNLEEAELYCERAALTAEKTLPPSHPLTAKTMHTLALVYRDKGRYSDALPLAERALAIHEDNSTARSMEAAEILDNLAAMFHHQGLYRQSLEYYKRTREVAEELLPPNSLYLASYLNDIANIYAELGKYREAMSLYEQALQIKEAGLPEDHPDIARTVFNLAITCHLQGEYGRSEVLHERALSMRKKTLPLDHPDIAQSLLHLAQLCFDQGEYASADSMLSKTLDIQERCLGLDHPDIAVTLGSVARLRLQQRRDTEGFRLALRASDIEHRTFVESSVVLTPGELLLSSKHLRESVDLLVSCFLSTARGDGATVSEVADKVLSCKGRVSDEVFARQRSLVQEQDSTAQRLVEDVYEARSDISELFVAGPGEMSPELYTVRLDSLRSLARDLETELARRSPSFRRSQDLQNVSADRIASLLPEGAVLVEYVKYDQYSAKTNETVPHYLAVVITGKSQPFIGDLGTAEDIDLLVAGYRAHVGEVSARRHRPLRRDLPEYLEYASRLHARLIGPIADQISGKRALFIAPDGALNVVSFAGLSDGCGKYLIEEYPIQYLSAGRDLIRLEQVNRPGVGLLAMGNPDFNALQAGQRTSSPTASPVGATWNLRSLCGDLRSSELDPLPGTADEVNLVARLWRMGRSEPADVFTGTQASEENFKAMAAYRKSIHVATHGYYLRGQCGTDSLGGETRTEEMTVDDHPLLLSGLFLSGAMVRQTVADSLRCEDGVLTAYEVSGMRLDGTELVVLSACETALGDVVQGEGVYGLRRAFQMAGGRTIVSALWRVPDVLTYEMMTELYQPSSEPLIDRMRSVQLSQIEKLRQQGLSDHPCSWGAFIALGDWR